MAPIFWHWDTVVIEYNSLVAILICLTLAVAYVASLYIGGPKQKGRDHPDVVKHRIVRVCIVCLFALPFLWFCSSKSHSVKARPLIIWIGMRFEGCVLATILPLLLTMILFMGPLSLHYLDGIFKLYKDPKYWTSSFKNLIWIRNHIVAPVIGEFVFRAVMAPFIVSAYGERSAAFIIAFISTGINSCLLYAMVDCVVKSWDMVGSFEEKPMGVLANQWVNVAEAPFSEEFIYRACMLPILVPAIGEAWSVLVCPLFFGVAHFHHMAEKVKDGVPLNTALIAALFQFSYTTVFGAYSAFLFLRTGHLMAPVIAHAFCNHMGFPNFREIEAQKPPARYYVALAFVVGLLLWYQLLYFLTTPSWYGNDLYDL